MQPVTGVFVTQQQAEQAVEKLWASGVQNDRVTLLAPGKHSSTEVRSVDAREQPSLGKAMGALVGGAAGLSGGLVIAVVPGVGLVAALGVLGAAILTAAGASVGAIAGDSFENSMTEGLPEDEIFVYEDALRRGRSVVIAFADDAASAARLGKVLEGERAETFDAAREQWWMGLRSTEQEHYLKTGRKFSDEEEFYRLGFEAALHARNRCKEFDQIASEMAVAVEELEHQNPGIEVEEPFTRGYERGREYYQRLCDESKVA